MGWPKPMSIVEVTWIDSSYRSRWHDPEDLDHWLDGLDLACRTVGYLYRDSADRVVIVQNQAACNVVAETIVIPKIAIRELVTLKQAVD